MPNDANYLDIQKILTQKQPMQHLDQSIVNLQTELKTPNPNIDTSSVINKINTLKTLQTLILIDQLEIKQSDQIIKYPHEDFWSRDVFATKFVVPRIQILKTILLHQNNYETALKNQFKMYLKKHQPHLLTALNDLSSNPQVINDLNADVGDALETINMMVEDIIDSHKDLGIIYDIIEFSKLVLQTDFRAYQNHSIYGFKHTIGEEYMLLNKSKKRRYKKGLLALYQTAQIPMQLRQITLNWWNDHVPINDHAKLALLYQMFENKLIFPSDYFNYQNQLNVNNTKYYLKKYKNNPYADKYAWCYRQKLFNKFTIYPKFSNKFIDFHDMQLKPLPK